MPDGYAPAAGAVGRALEGWQIRVLWEDEEEESGVAWEEGELSASEALGEGWFRVTYSNRRVTLQGSLGTWLGMGKWLGKEHESSMGAGHKRVSWSSWSKLVSWSKPVSGSTGAGHKQACPCFVRRRQG